MHRGTVVAGSSKSSVQLVRVRWSCNVLTVVLSYSLYHLLTNTQTGTRFC